MPGDSSDININSKGVEKNNFDAIVISGVNGGWAAKKFCEHGVANTCIGKRKRCKAYQRLAYRKHGAPARKAGSQDPIKK